MKNLGWGFVLFSIVYLVFHVGAMINHNLRFINEVQGFWDMADKTATIEKKSEYLDKYVAGIERLHLNEGYSAIIYKHYDNYMPNNFDALKSLQDRLHQIKNLDPKSFAYQTAMQQLTQQEWKGASEMSGQFQTKWCNSEALFTWGAFGWLSWLIIGLIFSFGVIFIVA